MKELNYNLEEFHKFIQNKKCVCIGSGAQGIRLITIFENWRCTDNILAFIDNAKEKQGTQISYAGFSYPIISVEDSLSLINKDTVIIITCTDIIGIKKQLDQYECLDENYCTSLIEIAQKQLMVSDYPEIKKESESQLIPKIIHYCWLGGEMPDLLKRNVDRWHKLCPDYEIKKWDESNYDFSVNPYMHEAYMEKKWGYVSDYMRLDIIYRYGGIYFDTDVDLIKKPDEFLYQKSFMMLDSSLLPASGAGFGARKGEPIIKELRDYYDDIHFVQNGKINPLTCIIYTMDVLKKYGIKINDSFQNIRGMNIYPMILQGTSTYTKQMRITDKTFWLHYGTTTWLDDNTNQIRKDIGNLYKNNEEQLLSYSDFMRSGGF